MIDLIFDTETTGFPLWKSPANDPRQPHLVQLAVVMAKGSELIHTWDTIVKCPIDIPEKAVSVHGITKERSQREGIELVDALTQFDQLLRTAERIICHNTNFDFKIMEYAYCRAEMENRLNIMSIQQPSVCTMKTATPLMKLLGSREYNLSKVYRALVDPAGFSDAHTADADAMACWKVLVELERRGVELL